MSGAGLPGLLLAGALVASDPAPATVTAAPAPASADDAPGVTAPEDERRWSVSGMVWATLVPDDTDYLQPTVLFDREWLHLEARYNYEDLRTFSTWVGYNLSVGTEVTLDFTPMVGAVFGDTAGAALGYRSALGWWKLELASEGEILFDAREPGDSYLYTWSDLTLAPLEWFRFGLSAQRTRAYETDVDVHRGLVAAFTWRRLDLSGYVFDLDTDNPVFVAGLSVTY